VKLFLDTNILLDMFLERDNGESKNIFTISSINLYINDITILNVYYILSKYSNKENALEAVKILRKRCHLVLVNETIIDLAIESDFSDFEDAVQFFCAKSIIADYILTQNKKDFLKSDIPVLASSEWLKT
jgi:predicted nucleic acid-binding protein